MIRTGYSELHRSLFRKKIYGSRIDPFSEDNSSQNSTNGTQPMQDEDMGEFDETMENQSELSPPTPMPMNFPIIGQNMNVPVMNSPFPPPQNNFQTLPPLGSPPMFRQQMNQRNDEYTDIMIDEDQSPQPRVFHDPFNQQTSEMNPNMCNSVPPQMQFPHGPQGRQMDQRSLMRVNSFATTKNEKGDLEFDKSVQNPFSMYRRQSSSNLLLPTIRPGKSKNPQCNTIHGKTLAKSIQKRRKQDIIMVDCRFPFEFRNGTIRGSVNIYQEHVLKAYFFTKKKVNSIIIFYCEYSSKRGPRMYESMRKFDREENLEKYPYLDYPQIYLLEGGYRKFYKRNKKRGYNLCEPDNYCKMDHPKYQCEFQRAWKEMKDSFKSKMNRGNGGGGGGKRRRRSRCTQQQQQQQGGGGYQRHNSFNLRMKRKRGADDESEEDWREKELRERLPTRKRRRKQLEEEDEEEEEEEDLGSILPVDDDDFIVRNEEEEEEDEEEEALVNKPDPGIIEEIQVENFMCHKKLKVEFKSHINVITGRNGSGKSAIIIAIQAVLGGKKPRQAQKVQDLIKEGEEGCYIRISLRNRGPDAFQPEIFGKRIIVERSITTRGTSSYKIMDQDGEVHYRTKKELEGVLRYFNIHVTNPCVVMSQDDAKSFLTTAKSDKKYDLFLEASQLKGMLEDFQHAKTQKDKMEISLKSKNERLAVLKSELDEMEKEMRITEKIGDLEKDLDEVRNLVMWRMVFDVERKMEKTKKKIEEESVGLREIEKKLKEIDDEIQKIRKEDEDISQQINTQYNKRRRMNTELGEKREEIRESRHHRTRIESKIGDLETKQRNATKFIKKIERKMEMIRNRVSTNNQEEVGAIEDAIQKDKLQKEKCEAEETKAREERKKRENMMDATEEDLEESTSKLNQLVKRVKREKEEIAKILRSQKDKLQVFSHDCQRLIDVLQEERLGFEKQPIGPVWLYLNVREQKWAKGIEEYLIREKENFIVHSSNDARKLKELCHRRRIRRPNVIVFPYVTRVHFVPERDRVERNMMTLDRQLRVDISLIQKRRLKMPAGGLDVINATIRNYLIDFRATERVILVEDRMDLEDVFFVRRPRNALRGVALNGTQVEWYNRKRYILAKYVQKVRFFAEEKDYTEQINQMKRSIEMYKKDEKPLQTEVRKKRKELRRVKDEFERFRKKEKKMRGLARRYGKQIHTQESRLKELIEQDQGDDEDREEELQEQRDKIEKIRQDITKMGIKIQTYHNEIEQLRPDDERIKGEIQKIKEQKDEIERLCDKLTEEARDKSREMSVLNGKDRTFRIDEAKKKKVVHLLNERLRHYEMDKTKCEENATTQHGNDSRPESILESVEELELKIREIERMLKREESKLEGRTVEQIKEHFNAQTSKYNEIKNYLEIGKKNLEAIKKGLMNRHNKWREIRNNLSKVAAVAFNRSLTRKGHSGKLHFDHEEETLSTEIRISRSEERKVKDTKSLSGGEKSFSTLALLTAMWYVSESPFRAVDEVDIFMDNVYRKKAMELLVGVSMTPTQINSQLIVVTPQSTRGILKMLDGTKKKHIHVIRMKDPVRDGLVQTNIEDFMGD